MNKQRTIAATISPDDIQHFAVIGLLAISMCILFVNSADAQVTVTGIGTVLCNAAYLVIYDIGRGLATLAVLAIGIAALLGKATWGQAISLAVGIGTVFGAITIVTVVTAAIPDIIFTIPTCDPFGGFGP